MTNKNILVGETLPLTYFDPMIHTLGDYFFYNCLKFPEKLCQIDSLTGQQETYHSVLERTVKMAINLRILGIKSKDKVVICTTNSLDNIIPLISSLYLGATVCSLHPSTLQENMEHFLELLEPKIIFVEPESLALIQNSAKNANVQPEIVVVFGSKEFEKLFRASSDSDEENYFRPVKINEDDIAFIYFSSGSTGVPKGICHSHKSFLKLLYVFYHYTRDFKEKVLQMSNFSWLVEIVIFASIFINGGCRVLCMDFSSKTLYKTIESYKITYVFFPADILHILTNFADWENYDVSSMLFLMVAGSGISVSALEQLRNIFKNAQVNLEFGLTEVGWVASCFRGDKSLELKKKLTTTSGQVLADITLKITDLEDESKVLGPNCTGEIRVKSPTMMVGYYKQPEVTRNAFDSDGFFKTGDIGYFDEDSCLFVIGRVKELFHYKSTPIFPIAIEAILCQFEDVLEAAVFGMRSEWADIGAIPAAAVVLKENSKLTESEIEDFVSKRVTDPEKLRGGVFFVKEIPKTTTGKRLRNKLQNMVASLYSDRVQWLIESPIRPNK